MAGVTSKQSGVGRLVRIEGVEGGEFFCGEDETILRAGLRAGFGMPYDCSVGTCGECKIQIVSGAVTHGEGRQLALTERDVARGRGLSCQARPDGDCSIRVHLEDKFIAKFPPTYHDVRLVSVEQIAPEMKRCVFASSAPAVFLPGQYARLAIPGSANWRAFSMSNLPNQDGEWEFMIRPVAGGCASDYLFLADRRGEGFTLDVPYGNAYYRPGARRIVCIAGGAGLAPMVSVARAAAADAACEAITVYYGGRTPEDLCAGAYLAPLERERLALAQYDVVSGDCPDWTGHRGFIHEHVQPLLAPDDSEASFYVAGPPAMVEATLETLGACGVPKENIFYDRFFS